MFLLSAATTNSTRKVKYYIWVSAFVWMLHGNYALRILGIFPTPSRSQQVTFQTIMKVLAERGHNITVISPCPLKKPFPNYDDIDVSPPVPSVISNYDVESLQNGLKGLEPFNPINKNIMYKGYKRMRSVLTRLPDVQLKYREMKEFIKTYGKGDFDLVFLETGPYERYIDLIKHLGSPPHFRLSSFQHVVAPVGTLQTRVDGHMYHQYLGSVADEKTLLEAWQWIVKTYILNIVAVLFNGGEQSIFMENYEILPSASFGEDKVKVHMLAGSPLFNYPLPLPPEAVTFHNVHVKPTGVMYPKDLLRSLNEATEGEIYFSLDENSIVMPEEVTRAFTEEFSELSHEILWKRDNEDCTKYDMNWCELKLQQDIIVSGTFGAFCGLERSEGLNTSYDK